MNVSLSLLLQFYMKSSDTSRLSHWSVNFLDAKQLEKKFSTKEHYCVAEDLNLLHIAQGVTRKHFFALFTNSNAYTYIKKWALQA